MPKINEHFYSIQGEGMYAGYPSIFIRFSNCVLACPWCDSKYAWDANNGIECEDFNFDELPECDHLVITGGEPLMHIENNEFKKFLSNCSYRFKVITFETTMLTTSQDINNTTIQENFLKLKNILSQYNKDTEYVFSVSPKLETNCYKYCATTGENIEKFYSLHDTDLIEKNNLIYKIVYDEENIENIKSFISNIDDKYKDRIHLMPKTPIPYQGEDFSRYEYICSCKDTIDRCLKMGLRYSPRLHIDVYAMQKGK